MGNRQLLAVQLISSIVALALYGAPSFGAGCGTSDKVVLEVSSAPRRDAMERLLSGRTINVQWIDESAADEPIRGVFEGDFVKVLHKLLSGTNWLFVYDGDESECRISKILVLGSATRGEPTAPKSDAHKDTDTADTQSRVSFRVMTGAHPPVKSNAPKPPSTPAARRSARPATFSPSSAAVPSSLPN